MRNENPTLVVSSSGLNVWLLAARPRTWIASVGPVCIGVSLADSINWVLFTLTLLFSLSIQIGTNLANDYFDFIKGADTKERIGPMRATASGLISPRSMYNAMWVAFGMALLFALPLMIRAGIWSLPLAALCILSGILYTGGPRPLGYLGLGELFVLIFFGPVACCGSYYLQTGSLNTSIFIASLAPGLFSTAILIANNLRDEKTDRKAGKNTLVARFGRLFGAWEYALCLVLGSLVPLCFSTPLASFVLIAALPSIRLAFTAQNAQELAPLLQRSGLLLFLYTFLFILSNL